jgi:hypothetical protein
MQLNFHVFRRMQGFENLLSEIVALGNLTEQLVEQKSSQQMLQKLQLYLEFFKTDPGFQKVALESAVKDIFASKVNKSESLVSQFKTLYFGNGLKNAQACVDKVQATAGGAGTTGGDWTESATSTSWPEFATQTETTLRAVDKIQLLLDIQACDSVAGLQILNLKTRVYTGHSSDCPRCPACFLDPLLGLEGAPATPKRFSGDCGCYQVRRGREAPRQGAQDVHRVRLH